MYEKFTDRARKVMQLANQAALKLNHEYIGTEHILLGLIKEPSAAGVAGAVLKALGVDLEELRAEVMKMIRPGPDVVTMGKLPHTPRSKKVIEFSIEEARLLGHNYVGTEHILMGLSREQEGVATTVLQAAGATFGKIKEQVIEMLGLGAEDAERNELKQTVLEVVEILLNAAVKLKNAVKDLT